MWSRRESLLSVHPAWSYRYRWGIARALTAAWGLLYRWGGARAVCSVEDPYRVDGCRLGHGQGCMLGRGALPSLWMPLGAWLCTR